MILVMPTRMLLGLSLIVLSMTSAACKSHVEAPDAAPPEASAEAGAAPVVVPEGGATAPSFEERMAKLPSGAALYFVMNLYDFEDAAKDKSLIRDLWSEITHGTLKSNESLREVLKSANVDSRRPLLGAVVPASEERARPVMDAVAQGATSEERKKLIGEHASDATRMRLLVPLAAGTKPWSAAERLLKALAPDATVLACPGAPPCAAFGAVPPLGLARDQRGNMAFYADGGDLRVEFADPVFAFPEAPASLEALITFRDARGGVSGHCSKLDASATASLCADTEQAGQMGTTRGYQMAIGALSGAPVDAETAKKIGVMGRDEARQNLMFAAPSRKLASDGTAAVFMKGERPRVRASWALTEVSRADVQNAFSTERCASGQRILDELVPAAIKAFGDPGKELSDPKAVSQAFREAGWGAVVVAFAGTWPNLMPAFSKLNSDKLKLKPPPEMQACLRYEDGRIYLQLQ